MSSDKVTYAILGGTGAMGSEAVSYLLSRDKPVHLNVYARSAERLYAMHPSLKSSPNASIFIGSISDINVLTSCLRSVSAIICGVAVNGAGPDNTISQVAAHSVVQALSQLRAESPSPSEYRAPLLIWPSSAANNTIFQKRLPPLILALGTRGGYYVLNDLKLAASYLRSQGDWLSVSLWQPGAIVDDEARGYQLTLTEGGDTISYPDLVRGIVQMVEEDGGKKWDGQDVGFKALGGSKVKGPALSAIGQLLRGLAVYYMPWLWWVGKKLGFW